MDLYEYEARKFLTMIDVFSRYAFAFALADKTADEVARVFDTFTSMFDRPKRVLLDNGPEFSKISVPKVPTPVSSPQSNGIVERLHRELGNYCRLYSVDPTVAVSYTRTAEKRLLFFSGLKLRFLESPVAVSMVTSERNELRSFPVHSLVWHYVQKRSRKKSAMTYSGPHRVMQRLSDTAYLLSSSATANPTKFFKASLNNIKKCTLPSTTGWELKRDYLLTACRLLDSSPDLPVFVDYDHLNENALDIMAFYKNFQASYVILPDIPCAPWYQALFFQLPHQRVQLPSADDLFLDASGSPVGPLPWKHYLVLLQQ